MRRGSRRRNGIVRNGHTSCGTWVRGKVGAYIAGDKVLEYGMEELKRLVDMGQEISNFRADCRMGLQS